MPARAVSGYTETHPAVMKRKDWLCVLVYLSMTVAVGFADLRMRPHTNKVVADYIPGVVGNTESAPGAYRVLAPFTIDAAARLTGASPLATWYATRLIFIFLALAAMHGYLRTWFPPEHALTGVALTAATLPLTFTNSWPHPDSMPELALFTLGAMAAARGAHLGFAGALALAALNRETSAFLVLLYAVARPLDRAHVYRTFAFALEWAAIYAALRAARGLRHYDYWQAGRHWTDLGLLPAAFDPYYRAYAYFAVVLFGPLLYLAFRAVARRNAPLFVARALLVVPVFVAVAFMFSNIIETRIFTPLYALIVPAALFALVTPLDTKTESR
jgi:hypothetical protein